MKILMSFCAVLILPCLSITAQTNKNRIKEFNSKFNFYIQQVAEKIPDIPAIAVVVIKDDKPIFLKAYGWADKDAGIKADLNTLFYISSSTKSFTALVAAMLDKEGSIRLNDPIIKHIKGITFKDPLPEKITVKNLLTHTSGLRNEPVKFRLGLSGQIASTDINRVFGEKTVFIDSNYNRYRYDNIGYNIYGLLLQQSLGKKWQELIQEKIFKPLKMDHTTCYISKAVSNKWTIAYPHVYTPDKGETRSPLEKNDSNMHAAGGIVTSITDIGTWLNMNMNRGKLNGKQVIPAEIIDKCQVGYTRTQRELAPFVGEGEYGLGWQIGKYKNEKVIYHHGGYTGYQSHVSFFPGKKIAVAVFVNDGTVGARACHMIATYAYDWWLQTDKIDDNFTKQLQDLANSFEAGKKSMQASFADRAKRTWQLTLPLESYTGKYHNPGFGTMEIFSENDILIANLGALRSVSTPFTEKETIRVELIPGEGKVIVFTKSAEDKIESLIWEGMQFKRIN